MATDDFFRARIDQMIDPSYPLAFWAEWRRAAGKLVVHVQVKAAFTEADTSSLFEASGKPMQVAALSSVEMKETEGAFLPILAAAAFGAASGGVGSAALHAISRHAQGLPVTQQGLRIAAASGAVTGAVAGPLIGAAGGGVIGNVAWRPGLAALNNGMQRAANGVMGNQ